MPPTYSAPRFQAISEEQARHLETTLLWPATKTMNKTFVHQFPDHGWYRVRVPQATQHTATFMRAFAMPSSASSAPR
eukprot:COSAG04_NODE_494_length_13425_cov_65.898619_15_plen_77_part_00